MQAAGGGDQHGQQGPPAVRYTGNIWAAPISTRTSSTPSNKPVRGKESPGVADRPLVRGQAVGGREE